MSSLKRLRVVLISPSRYDLDGVVQRYRWFNMPNSALVQITSMTPEKLDGCDIEIHSIDEWVETDLGYLRLLMRNPDCTTLLALVGVQGSQFQRALDLAAYARESGVEHCVIGGPHPMTCDTSNVQNRGISISLAEAEVVWPSILRDAITGELSPVYGEGERWQTDLRPPVLKPPSRKTMSRYFSRRIGITPFRGCPNRCKFCAITKVAGPCMRSQPIETTIQSFRAVKAAGFNCVMITSDNFNRHPDAKKLLQVMIDEQINIRFFALCDSRVVHQEEFIELLGRAGCFSMLVGIESFSKENLGLMNKQHNHPESYAKLVQLCHQNGIVMHASNIIGFPTDTEKTIKEHLRLLRAIGVVAASFYILSPHPGTELYDEFMTAGLMSERNLDRYDGVTLTFNHPHFTHKIMQEQLFECYKKFYAGPQIVLGNARLPRSQKRNHIGRCLSVLYLGVFSRLAAYRHIHPVAGGLWRVKLDKDTDYLELRRKTYDFDRAPLPASLPMPPIHACK